MAKRPGPDSKILREIVVKFSRQRRINGKHRGHLTDGLRQLAVSAVESGHTPGEVARAAQVSRQSVVNWRVGQPRVRPIKAPVELKLIDGRETEGAARFGTGAIQSEPCPTARILLRSGVTVELPASCLDAGLWLALNGSAP